LASDGTKGSSIFEMQVYAQRTIGTDDYIGGLKDTVEILFANGTINGMFHASEYRSINSIPTPPIVVTRNLRKNDKNGNSQEIPTIMEFTISSFASSDEATIAQLDEVVEQAKEAYKHIGTSPSVEASASTRDVVGVAVDAIPSVTNVLTAWEPLLEKVKLFTEIMDKITEV
jgi:hypothetical protein